ncbi:hypothetical protein ACFV23_48640, partial [Streptomyces sp. NPDC059627]
MALPPRPGDQLASATSTARVIVIRAPADAAAPIECGGGPFFPVQGAPAAPSEQDPSGRGLG